MRVEVVIDLGIRPDEAEYTAEFDWELGDLPLPRRRDRIAFGELITVVRQVQYGCVDRDYIASRDHAVAPVGVQLRVKLTKATRRGSYSAEEVRLILSFLASVTDLHVTGTG